MDAQARRRGHHASTPPLIQDLRYAIRRLVRDRSFSILAAGTLALGVAIMTASFTVVVIPGIQGSARPIAELRRDGGDAIHGHHDAVVVSARYWRTVAAANSSFVGSSLRLHDGRSAQMRLFRHVVTRSLALGFAGIGLGLAVGLIGAPFLEPLLHEVEAVDPLTVATATGLLLGAASLASLAPGIRAARSAPADTLRQD